MAQVHKLARAQVIDEEILRDIEERVAAARRGEVTDIVFVCDNAADGVFFRVSHFQNAWHILGALEYAKAAVSKGMD